MSEVIDLKDALERVQEDKELLFELFDIFIEDFVGKRDQIWKAFKEGNVSAFQALAHGFKGATGNISAKQMHENCVELDTIAKMGDISGVEQKLTLLDEQFEAFKAEAERLKSEAGS